MAENGSRAPLAGLPARHEPRDRLVEQRQHRRRVARPAFDGSSFTPPAAGSADAASRRARAGPGGRGRRRSRARSGSSRPSRTGRRRRCTAAARARQRAEHLDDAVQDARRRGGERDHVGLLGLDERARCRAPGRPAPSWITSQPSASRKSATIRSAERVQLLGRPRDDRQPPVLRRALQLPRQAVEDRLGDRGRVVLLGDVERAHRPPVPDLAQRGLEHLEVDVRDRDAVLERALDAPRARAESRASSAARNPSRCS